MKKKIKKAFTLVELLVVIAILAILATVSIVGYNSFTKKAKVSNDTVLVKQMNDVLFANQQTDDKNNTMTEALEDVFGAGYDVEKLTPTTTNYNIVWDSENDQMVLLDDSKNVVYPTEKVTSKDKMFLITKTAKDFTDTKDEFAHYLTSEFTYDGALTITTGLDAGSNTNVKNISYTGGETGKTVSINTNKDTILNVDASLDTVYHYGDVKKVDIEAVAGNSYHEYGNVLGNIEIKKGRVVVEKGSNVSTIIVESERANDVKVEVTTGSVIGTIAPTTEAAKSDIKNSNSIPTDSVKEEIVIVNKDFAGGLGTEKSPYLVESAEQLYNISKYDNVSYFKQVSNIKIEKPVNKICGYYDGNDNTIEYTSNTSLSVIFNEMTNYLEIKNLNVVIGKKAVSLLNYADCGTSFGAKFENITFNSNEKLTTANSNNYGLVVLQALYTGETEGATYSFINITNNVNIQNEGTCTGFIVGSGPCFNSKTILNYENCVNNATIKGNSSVGFLYGNGAYITSFEETRSIINIKNCKNNGIFMSTSENSTVEFAPKLASINSKYQNEVNGSFINNSYFTGKTISINQNNNSFSINTNDTSVSYKLAFNVEAKYFTKDGKAWTDSDVDLTKDKDNWHSKWDVSNGVKHIVELPISTTEDGSLSKSFKALDKKSAANSGITVSSFENGFAIVVNGDVTYLVFDVDESTYINCNVSLMVYAYDSSNSLLGVKTVA